MHKGKENLLNGEISVCELFNRSTVGSVAPLGSRAMKMQIIPISAKNTPFQAYLLAVSLPVKFYRMPTDKRVLLFNINDC